MELERVNRCKEKIELAIRRISKIEQIFGKFEDETFKLAIYKAFQEVVESLTDLIAMLLVDKKRAVEDDYTNIEKIKEITEFEDKEIAILKEANGLRNRIIHKYNKTDDETAKESIESLLPELIRIINKFGDFIEKNAKQTKD